MTRLERKVAKEFARSDTLGVDVAKLLRAELQAVRRMVKAYKANAPHYSDSPIPYRKACDDILAKLEEHLT